MDYLFTTGSYAVAGTDTAVTDVSDADPDTASSSAVGGCPDGRGGNVVTHDSVSPAVVMPAGAADAAARRYPQGVTGPPEAFCWVDAAQLAAYDLQGESYPVYDPGSDCVWLVGQHRRISDDAQFLLAKADPATGAFLGAFAYDPDGHGTSLGAAVSASRRTVYLLDGSGTGLWSYHITSGNLIHHPDAFNRPAQDMSYVQDLCYLPAFTGGGDVIGAVAYQPDSGSLTYFVGLDPADPGGALKAAFQVADDDSDDGPYSPVQCFTMPGGSYDLLMFSGGTDDSSTFRHRVLYAYTEATATAMRLLVADSQDWDSGDVYDLWPAFTPAEGIYQVKRTSGAWLAPGQPR